MLGECATIIRTGAPRGAELSSYTIEKLARCESLEYVIVVRFVPPSGMNGEMLVYRIAERVVEGYQDAIDSFNIDVDEVEEHPGALQVAEEVDAQPGNTYYIWQEVKMGMMSAGSKLHVVDAAQGKKGVGETSLAATK